MSELNKKFYEACVNNDTDTVKQLINDVNITTNTKYKCLYNSIKFNINMLKLLSTNESMRDMLRNPHYFNTTLSLADNLIHEIHPKTNFDPIIDVLNFLIENGTKIEDVDKDLKNESSHLHDIGHIFYNEYKESRLNGKSINEKWNSYLKFFNYGYENNIDQLNVAEFQNIPIPLKDLFVTNLISNENSLSLEYLFKQKFFPTTEENLNEYLNWVYYDEQEIDEKTLAILIANGLNLKKAIPKIDDASLRKLLVKYCNDSEDEDEWEDESESENSKSSQSFIVEDDDDDENENDENENEDDENEDDEKS